MCVVIALHATTLDNPAFKFHQFNLVSDERLCLINTYTGRDFELRVREWLAEQLYC